MLPLIVGLGVETAGTLIIADYVTPPDGHIFASPAAALSIDGQFRDWIETTRAEPVAETIYQLLPKSDKEMKRLLAVGQAVAQNMSWDVVVEDYFLPALESAREPVGGLT